MSTTNPIKFAIVGRGYIGQGGAQIIQINADSPTVRLIVGIYELNSYFSAKKNDL
jgi:hypothetical protein